MLASGLASLNTLPRCGSSNTSLEPGVIASLILEVVALALSLFPRTQHERPLPTAGAPFAYLLEKNRWVELLEHWFVRAALCILGTIGLVIFFGVIIYFWDLLLRA